MGAAVLATALALSVTAGTASAHKITYASNVQLKADAVSDTVLGLSGKVTSERAKCIAGRDVTVTYNGIFLATATTLINGDWSVQSTTRPAKGTTLIASIPRTFLKKSKKHKHKCGSDFSERKAP